MSTEESVPATTTMPIGNNTPGPGEPAPAPMGPVPEKPKLSKMEQKRQQIYIDRRNRKLKEGVPEQIVDQVLAREDYERLPPDAKIQRLEGMIKGVLGQISNDVQALRQNDATIAQAMDVNFRALGKALNKLGITAEDQRALMAEAYDELKAEYAAKEAAKAASKEHAVAEQVLVQEDHQGEAPTSEAPVETPEGATSFGG